MNNPWRKVEELAHMEEASDSKPPRNVVVANQAEDLPVHTQRENVPMWRHWQAALAGNSLVVVGGVSGVVGVRPAKPKIHVSPNLKLKGSYVSPNL